MKRKRARLALPVITVVAVSLLAASSFAATPALHTRLFAAAGPVQMHATLTLATPTPVSAKVNASLSSCVIQPASKPRSGIADKLICTTPSGAKVTMPLSTKAATLTYHLAAAGSFNLQSATVQIRHHTTTLATLNPTGGNMTLSLNQAATVVNGHSTLYVHAGAHTYTAKIVQVH